MNVLWACKKFFLKYQINAGDLGKKGFECVLPSRQDHFKEILLFPVERKTNRELCFR